MPKFYLVGIFMIIVLAISTIFYSFVPEERANEQGIKWMKYINLQDSLQKKPKRIFIKIYTDWCTVCKMMDKKTFSKSRVYEPMSEYYYAVALNAEDTIPLKYKDSTFTFNKSLGPQGTHNLAYYLGKDAEHMSYPTIVILDEKMEILYKYPSFMSVLNLEEVLYLYKDIEK